MPYLSYAIACLSTAAATIAGLYFTHSPWCLWALVLPLFIEIRTTKNDELGSKEDKKQ